MMLGPRIVLGLLVGICLTQGESGSSCRSASPSSVIDLLVGELRATASHPTADPRVLLALRLHSVTPDPDTETILRRIREQAVDKGATFTSGMLALYVLALRASCVNPANVTSGTSSVNLVSLLEEKLAAEMKSIVIHHHPETTYYQVALALLGLCQQGSPVSQTDVQTFSAAVMNGKLRQGSGTAVDTEAVSALALRCLQQESYKPADAVRDALVKLTMELYCARTVQHTIGNLYSTGLTAQALIANEGFIPAPVWGAEEILEELRAQAEKGAFSFPVLVSQVLPALLWTSYLDAGRIPCSASVPPGPAWFAPAEISVNYTVTRAVNCTDHCSHSVPVDVPVNSTILDVMKKAESKEPEYFSFSTEPTAWGEYVNSIGGTAASTQDRTYWQFLVGTVPIPVGVAAYNVSLGEHVVAKFTTY